MLFRLQDFFLGHDTANLFSSISYFGNAELSLLMLFFADSVFCVVVDRPEKLGVGYAFLLRGSLT